MSNSLVFLIANEWGLKFMLDLFSLWKPYSWLGLSIRTQIRCFAFFPTVKDLWKSRLRFRYGDTLVEPEVWREGQKPTQSKVQSTFRFALLPFSFCVYHFDFWEGGDTEDVHRHPNDHSGTYFRSQLRKGVSAFEWAKCSLLCIVHLLLGKFFYSVI